MGKMGALFAPRQRNGSRKVTVTRWSLRTYTTTFRSPPRHVIRCNRRVPKGQKVAYCKNGTNSYGWIHTTRAGFFQTVVEGTGYEWINLWRTRVSANGGRWGTKVKKQLRRFENGIKQYPNVCQDREERTKINFVAKDARVKAALNVSEIKHF